MCQDANFSLVSRKNRSKLVMIVLSLRKPIVVVLRSISCSSILVQSCPQKVNVPMTEPL